MKLRSEVKCLVCSLRLVGWIFPTLSWVKLRRRDFRVTRTAPGRHSSALISEMVFALAAWTTRPAALNLQDRQDPWTTQGWIWAFLWLLPFYRAQEAFKEGLWLLFPTRQGVGIVTHTGLRKGWCGGTELLQDLTETGIPVLCFALLQPLLSTRVTREMKWRSYLPRRATGIDAQSSQCLSGKPVQNVA